MGGALTSGKMENLAGITPFVYCYADNLLEISLSSRFFVSVQPILP
jgi:hypothetical protein